MKIVGNSQFQRAANASLILNTLRERREASRIELSATLGLRPSTVTYIVNRLMSAGLVREKVGKMPVTKSGRPPVLLEINKDFGRVVGLDLQADYYNAVVTDTTGTILRSLHKEYESRGPSFEELFQSVCDEILQDEGESPILGVGLAVPGVVDHERSIIKDCWTHNLKNRDFTAFFEAGFEYPIVIENDANCCAWKSLWDRGELEKDTFLYLLPRFHRKEILPPGYPSIGVGLGLVFNGAVYHGYSHRAGEFRSVFLGGGDATQISLTQEEMERISDDSDILRRLAVELLKNMFALIHILNPRSLFIGGNLAGQGPMIQEVLNDELKEEWRQIEQTGCSLRVLEDAEMDVAKGAAYSMLTELYSIPQLGESDENQRKWRNLLSNIIEND